MDDIIIRDVIKSDIPSIADIIIDGWKMAYKGMISDDYLNAMNREDTIERINKNHKKYGYYIVAEQNKEVVGFCSYIDSNEYTTQLQDIECEILALYVRPDLKYNGIGRKLFQYVIEEFRDKNKNKMIVWCLKQNEAAKIFYKKMGGEIVKENEKVIALDKINYYEVGFRYNLS